MPHPDWPVVATPPLTKAQMRIMACIARGNLPTKVPKLLGLSRSTVNTQLQRIKKRLGTEDWFQAFLRYQKDPGALGEYDPPSSQEALGRKWRGT